MKTVYLTLLHNAIKLFSIIDYYITVFIVVLPHTSTGPAVHTATDITMPEHITFSFKTIFIELGQVTQIILGFESSQVVQTIFRFRSGQVAHPQYIRAWTRLGQTVFRPDQIKL
jgi:hypothetical protein